MLTKYNALQLTHFFHSIHKRIECRCHPIVPNVHEVHLVLCMGLRVHGARKVSCCQGVEKGCNGNKWIIVKLVQRTNNYQTYVLLRDLRCRSKYKWFFCSYCYTLFRTVISTAKQFSNGEVSSLFTLVDITFYWCLQDVSFSTSCFLFCWYWLEYILHKCIIHFYFNAPHSPELLRSQKTNYN